MSASCPITDQTVSKEAVLGLLKENSLLIYAISIGCGAVFPGNVLMSFLHPVV